MDYSSDWLAQSQARAYGAGKGAERTRSLMTAAHHERIALALARSGDHENAARAQRAARHARKAARRG